MDMMREVGPSSKSDLISELERLGRLRAEGIITEVEFERLKGALLEKTLPIVEQRAIVSGTTTGSRYDDMCLPFNIFHLRT